MPRAVSGALMLRVQLRGADHLMDAEVGFDTGSPAWQARETQLLLSVLDLALSRIALAADCRDDERASRYLSQALDSYGSVKGLLPKLGLTAEQRKAVPGVARRHLAIA